MATVVHLELSNRTGVLKINIVLWRWLVSIVACSEKGGGVEVGWGGGGWGGGGDGGTIVYNPRQTLLPVKRRPYHFTEMFKYDMSAEKKLGLIRLVHQICVCFVNCPEFFSAKSLLRRA